MYDCSSLNSRAPLNKSLTPLRDLKPLATRRRFAGNGSVLYKKRNEVDDGFRSRPVGLPGELTLCVANFHQAVSMLKNLRLDCKLTWKPEA